MKLKHALNSDTLRPMLIHQFRFIRRHLQLQHLIKDDQKSAGAISRPAMTCTNARTDSLKMIKMIDGSSFFFCISIIDRFELLSHYISYWKPFFHWQIWTVNPLYKLLKAGIYYWGSDLLSIKWSRWYMDHLFFYYWQIWTAKLL